MPTRRTSIMYNELDNCARCLGMFGGARGNENIINARTICDYCHVAIDNGESEIICQFCRRPYDEHSVIDREMLETLWKEGINPVVCGEFSERYPNNPVLVSKELRAPENPCDEDFMKEIST